MKELEVGFKVTNITRIVRTMIITKESDSILKWPLYIHTVEAALCYHGFRVVSHLL